VLVVEDERETYDVSGHPSVRYRARINDARQRLARADALLLRPDRIVAAAADTPDLRAWLRHLGAAGIHPAENPAEVRHA